MTAQATSPFVQTALGTTQGWVSRVQAYDQTVLAATGTITLTTFAIPITKARLRIKSSAVNAATTQAIGIVTGTDGTSTVTLSPALLATSAAGTSFDLTTDLFSDLQLTSISFTVTLAGGAQASTISSELFGIP